MTAGIVIPLTLVPPRQRDPVMLVVMGTCIAIGIGLIAVLIAALTVRGHSMPVRWKEYRPDKAMLKLQFRRSAQAKGLLEAMGIALPASTAAPPGIAASAE